MSGVSSGRLSVIAYSFALCLCFFLICGSIQ
jgi:hypothetical protein